MSKPFFVGQRSLRVLERRPLRQQLVGFTLRDAGDRRPKECHLVIDGGKIAGRVTSIQHSATLGRAIGLALVEPSVVERGEFRIRIEQGEELTAVVTTLPFYDAQGERQVLEEHDEAVSVRIA
jgi:sarcosine oxidase subunit alpha